MNPNLKLQLISFYHHYFMKIFIQTDRHSTDQVVIDDSDDANTFVGLLGQTVKWMLNYRDEFLFPEIIDWYSTFLIHLMKSLLMQKFFEN